MKHGALDYRVDYYGRGEKGGEKGGGGERGRKGEKGGPYQIINTGTHAMCGATGT